MAPNNWPPNGTTFGNQVQISKDDLVSRDAYVHWLDVRLKYEKVRWVCSTIVALTLETFLFVLSYFNL